jgi:protein-tyrosine phosphatase
MTQTRSYVDIHCHLLPGIDDGAASIEESCRMAQMAVDEGIRAIVVTPHQLGSYRETTAEIIRCRTDLLRQRLGELGVPIDIYPGADVRVDSDLIDRLSDGTVMTLADRCKHVLLELPHDFYFPIQKLLAQLARLGLRGVLSHPERNVGIQRDLSVVANLIQADCLMQITSGSLIGAFGSPSQKTAVEMLRQGHVHFVATDAHGAERRRPMLSAAYECVIRLMGETAARQVFFENPLAVVEGRDVETAPRPPRRNRTWFARHVKTG